jgi:hypothetical protein
MFNDDQRMSVYPTCLVKVILHPERLVEARLEDSKAQRILDETGNCILSTKGEFLYDDP